MAVEFPREWYVLISPAVSVLRNGRRESTTVLPQHPTEGPGMPMTDAQNAAQMYRARGYTATPIPRPQSQ